MPGETFGETVMPVPYRNDFLLAFCVLLALSTEYTSPILGCLVHMCS